MTAPRGIGKGNNSGGKKPGAGRPRGSRNRRSAALIAEAEATGRLLPLDHLLATMRDTALPLRDRTAAALGAAPYCHARLTTLPAFSNPEHLDDTALLSQNTRLEQYIAKAPQGDPTASVTTQVEQMLEELPQLPHRSQESLLRKLVAAGEAGLQRLNDPNRPGAVVQRPAPRPVPEAAPEPPDDRVLHYDPIARKLVRPA